MSRIGKSIETECRLVVAWKWKGRGIAKGYRNSLGRGPKHAKNFAHICGYTKTTESYILKA